MRDERPTLRPVSIGRLVEVVDICGRQPSGVDDVVNSLVVTKRRAREILHEARRIGLVESVGDGDSTFESSDSGAGLLNSILNEQWVEASNVLVDGSPHYRVFLSAVDRHSPISLPSVVEQLQKKDSRYTFNETGVSVTADWAERLGEVQRNVFSGRYYRPSDYYGINAVAESLVETYRDLDETAGLRLRQRFVSIPRLREETCERTGTSRSVFDAAIRILSEENVGRIELSGAPLDTKAKQTDLSVKRICLSNTDSIVSTIQSSEPVLAGVELGGKQHYYFAMHAADDELRYPNER